MRSVKELFEAIKKNNEKANIEDKETLKLSKQEEYLKAKVEEAYETVGFLAIHKGEACCGGALKYSEGAFVSAFVTKLPSGLYSLDVTKIKPNLDGTSCVLTATIPAHTERELSGIYDTSREVTARYLHAKRGLESFKICQGNVNGEGVFVKSENDFVFKGGNEEEDEQYTAKLVDGTNLLSDAIETYHIAMNSKTINQENDVLTSEDESEYVDDNKYNDEVLKQTANTIKTEFEKNLDAIEADFDLSK